MNAALFDLMTDNERIKHELKDDRSKVVYDKAKYAKNKICVASRWLAWGTHVGFKRYRFWSVDDEFSKI